MTREEIEKEQMRRVGDMLRENFGRAAESLVIAAEQLYYAEGDSADYGNMGAEEVARVEFLKACERARRPNADGSDGGEIVVAIALRTLLLAMCERGATGLMNAVYANEAIDGVTTQSHGADAKRVIDALRVKAWREFMAEHCK